MTSGGDGPRLVAQFETEASGTFNITVLDNPPAPGVELWAGYPGWGWRPQAFGGRPGRCAEPIDGLRCAVVLGSALVSVGSGASTALTPSHLDAIFGGLHLVDIDDASGWVAVDDAYPGQ